MEYVDVQWRHKSANDPLRLVSEMDDQRYEVRKLEFFPSGLVGFASLSESAHGTKLGEAPIPPLSQINNDPQFAGVAIDSAAFEALWSYHVANAT